ncbi:MAG: peptidase [Acidobacteria bacterium]|nr:peptidase [Acidobacteriota bacterium]
MTRISLLAASMLLLLLSVVSPSNAVAAAPHAPRQVIVKVRSGFTPRTLANVHIRGSRALLGQFRFKGKVQATATAHGLDRLYVVDIDSDDVEAVAAELGKDPHVEYAEPNFEVKLYATPNDPSFAQQWSLAKVQAPQAWDSATSASGVVVGVIDTGADINHPDLAANIWTNPGEIAGNGIDDDGNGFVDDVHGWNFNSNNSNLTDNLGHGTHVAGIAGAIGNNGAGVSGAAWSAKLAILKGFDSGTLFITGAIAAQQYANMMGFRITTNSWGWDNEAPSQAMQDAIAASETAGYLFIAAAGNLGKDGDAFPSFPAGYLNSNVISVASTTASDTLAPYSSWGATRVDLAAPGDQIFSTWPLALAPAGGYQTLSGTSMAAPLAAGAAALLWTAQPSLTAVQVRDALIGRSDPVPALFGKIVSGGRLNLFNLFDPERIAPAAIGDLNVLDATYRAVTIRFTATGDDGTSGNASRYDVRISESPITEANFGAATPLTGVPGAQPNATIETMKLGGIAPSKAYYIALRAIDNAGNASAISNVVAFNSAAISVAYEDDARGGNHGWTIDGTNGVGGPALWNILPVRNFADRPMAWCYYNDATLSYDTGARNWGTLTSPVIDLRQSRDSRLSVTHFLWTDRSGTRDLGQIQVSSDGGPYTTLLTKDFTFYDFVTDVLDLSAYDGHQVRVRFSFDTVDAYANYYQGWVIKQVTVESATANRPPSISIPAATAGTEDQTVNFAATASDADGDPLEYRWDFGDGSIIFSPSSSVSHVYTKGGTFTANVTAYDGHNKAVSVSTVTIANVNDRPVAYIEMGFGGTTVYAAVPHTVSAIGSTDEDGDTLTARFDLGDGMPVITLPPGGWSFDHTWAQPGPYTITLIVNDGHVDSLPVTKTINALPDGPTAVPGGPYIGNAGVAIAFDGNGSWDRQGPIASYSWSFGDGATATGAAPSHAYAADGSYNASLTVTDGEGLTNTVNFVITIGNGLATAAIAGDYVVCSGNVTVPLVLTGVAPFTVTWSDNYVQTVNSLPASRSLYASSPSITWSLLSMRDARGAGSVSGQAIIRTDANSFRVAQSGNMTCNGAPVTLTAGRAKSYLWSTGATTRSITVTQGGSFTCTATFDDGCSRSDYPYVSAINPPSIYMSAQANVCANSTYQLYRGFSSNAYPITVVWSDGVTETIPNSSASSYRTVTTPASGSLTYRVTSLHDGACSGDVTNAATTLTVISKPTAVVRPTNDAFCPGGSVQVTVDLTGVSPWDVTFSDGTILQTNGSPLTWNFTPTATTTYTVTNVANGGCSAPGSGSVTYTLTSGSVSGTATICRGTSTTITATLAGKAPFTVTWSDGNVQTVNSGTTASRSVSPTATTTYTATVKDAKNCTVNAAGSAVVTIIPAATATLSGSASICGAGGSATITPTVTGTFPVTLVWSDGFTQSVTAAGQGRTVSPASTTTYTITSVSDGGTCAGIPSGSFTVTGAMAPTATVSAGGSFCPGSNVTISAALTGTGPWSLTWSDGTVQNVSASPATRSVSPAAATTYTISSLTGNGCAGTSSGSAVATPKTVTITAQPANVTIPRNTTTTLSVTATAGGTGTVLHYQWYKGTSGTTTTPVGTDSRTFTTPKLTATTSYWVRITADTCTGSRVNSATAKVTVP